MTYIDITFAGLQLRARLFERRAPASVAAFRAQLPLEGRAFQDQYSAQIMRLTCNVQADTAGDHTFGYQHAGLVMLDPTTGDIAVCFGRGRLQNALGPIAAIPIAEIGGDLSGLNHQGDQLQFQGARPIRLALSQDQVSPLEEAPLTGRRIVLTLASAHAAAVLMEGVSPVATSALSALLPLRGRATNTYASGPLTRLWNSTGGPQGVTPLEVPESEITATTLYAGGYYLSTKPYRGIRISAQEPTAMGGGRSALAPLFRFVGEWSAFAEQAALLTMEGERTSGSSGRSAVWR